MLSIDAVTMDVLSGRYKLCRVHARDLGIAVRHRRTGDLLGPALPILGSACQTFLHPKKRTLTDFWRLIMADKAKHIRVDDVPAWVDPMLYTWTTQAVHIIAGIWFLLLIPVLAMAESGAIPRLHVGLLYCVQPFLMYTILSKQVNVLDTGDRAWDATHSAAPYVTVVTPATAVVKTWWRFFSSLAICLGDLVFLGFKVSKCFGATGCTPHGTLYAVTLIFILAQALLCAAASYLLLRMPFSPTVWLRNPASLARAPTNVHYSRILGKADQQH